MLNAENIKDAELRRLAWRCRRGMLELDIVLQRFIALHFNDITLAQLKAFDDLLDLPDNDFWTLISSDIVTPKNPDTVDVVNKIRALKQAH
ncbi:MAG: succinate dehydrogenase assembly factor 2 [Methylotenera sp.]|nr:succinate dehydrogenase assembly factor 2 [Methylotenera sp.]OQW70760.1 MAG: succinate dehydrogenase assembly factor 2 family protein [Proteobacteria bacterium ST_bin12]